MKTVAIAGVGLIGGSFGLALRKAGFDGEILGVSSAPAIESAMAAGAISRSVTLNDAAETADLIYLAQPVDRILDTIRLLGPMVRPECLVTDAGSTKTAIAMQGTRSFPLGNFLGGHPLAGKESRGAQSADADLFQGKPYVLTAGARPHSLPPPFDPVTGEFRQWLVRIGAVVLEMTPEEHDATVALTSHMPQLLSTALAVTLSQRDNPYLTKVFGPGLMDMTRLALSSPELWVSILATNKAAVTEALDAYLEQLTQVRQALQTDELERWFTAGSAFAATLRK